MVTIKFVNDFIVVRESLEDVNLLMESDLQSFYVTEVSGTEGRSVLVNKAGILYVYEEEWVKLQKIKK